MSRPLKIFMRGKRIGRLQEMIVRMGYSMRDQKGVFGADTRDAVKDIQKQRGLKPTGQVDEALFQMMQGHAPSPESREPASPAVEQAANSIDQSRLDALIRLLVRKGIIETDELEAEMRKVFPATLD